MSDERQIGRIVGPPGTGKTTEILRLMSAACAKYSHDRIGASSLTRAAVQEMRSRVARAANVEGAVNKNIRTMHSHAFRLLEAKKSMMAESRLDEWNEAHPEHRLSLNAQTVALRKAEDDGFLSPTLSGETAASKAMAMVNHNRLTMLDQRHWHNYERSLFSLWKQWMFVNGYIDYTGLLEEVLKQKLVPDIDILFVDEAQDMSPLQAAIAKMWSEHTRTAIYAGDYQQAIFRFAGASPEVFLNLEHTWPKELQQSYRVPKNVLDHAMLVISRATDCSQFKYHPRKGDEGEYLGIVGDPDLSLDGSHMIICRYRHEVSKWVKLLIDEGVPFQNKFRESEISWNPATTKPWWLAKTYMTLMVGGSVPGSDMRKLLSKIKAAHNIKRGCRDDAISSVDTSTKYNLFNLHTIEGLEESFVSKVRSYDDLMPSSTTSASSLIRKIWDRPHDIINEPKVTVGTIHSVKGGEADNVWVEGKTTKAKVRQISSGEEVSVNDERRIAYVAVTRAKKRLGFVTHNKGRGIYSPFYCCN